MFDPQPDARSVAVIGPELKRFGAVAKILRAEPDAAIRRIRSHVLHLARPRVTAAHRHAGGRKPLKIPAALFRLVDETSVVPGPEELVRFGNDDDGSIHELEPERLRHTGHFRPEPERPVAETDVEFHRRSRRAGTAGPAADGRVFQFLKLEIRKMAGIERPIASFRIDEPEREGQPGRQQEFFPAPAHCRDRTVPA